MFRASCAILLLALGQARLATAGQQAYAEGRVLVQFKPTVAAHRVKASGLAQQRVATAGASGTASALAPTSHVFHITDGKTVEEKLEQLSKMPDVLIAEPDYRITVFGKPNDPSYKSQWHHPKISAPAAWDTVVGTHTVKVCVIDSGMRLDHPDLAANVVKGWSVIPMNETSDPWPQPSDPMWVNYNDTLGHGTHVAGLVAALGNNSRGVSGVAWRTALMPCRFIGNQGGGYVSDAITCMQLCREEGAHIYSNSWGGVPYQGILLSEIKALQASRGLFIVAAGNSGSDLADIPDIAYPAAFTADNLMVVAATTERDVLAGFSNYNREKVHLAAPGDQILSTTRDGGYGTMSGTSMATPIVAGAAALLQAMAMSVGPPLGPKALRKLLMDTSDPIVGGASKLVSGGKLNIGRAVQQLKTQLTSGQWPLSDALPSVGALPVPLPQLPPSAPFVPAPPPPPGPAYTSPQCGASPLRGRPAVQSSTGRARAAGNAVNGDCRTDAVSFTTACAATDPSASYPWWTATLAQQGTVVAVSLMTRSDCCWEAIGGAQVLVGNATWDGPASRASFVECGRVPVGGPPRGQRLTLPCAQGLLGSSVVVYLPKLKTSLALCEVDITLAEAGSAAAAGDVSVTAAPPSAHKRRTRSMLRLS